MNIQEPGGIREGKMVYKTGGKIEGRILDSPEKVVEYMKDAFEDNPMQESIWVIMLGTKNHPIGRVIITLGILNEALCHPREVMKALVLGSAHAFILTHNHPSGEVPPKCCRSSSDTRNQIRCRNHEDSVD